MGSPSAAPGMVVAPSLLSNCPRHRGIMTITTHPSRILPGTPGLAAFHTRGNFCVPLIVTGIAPLPGGDVIRSTVVTFFHKILEVGGIEPPSTTTSLQRLPIYLDSPGWLQRASTAAAFATVYAGAKSFMSPSTISLSMTRSSYSVSKSC
jgi:hypothetical protein